VPAARVSSIGRDTQSGPAELSPGHDYSQGSGRAPGPAPAIVVAIIGACILIAILRAVSGNRARV